MVKHYKQDMAAEKGGFTNTVAESDRPGDIYVEQIEGCEYVLWYTYKGVGMVHKHNCQPCHNRKMQETPIPQPKN